MARRGEARAQHYNRRTSHRPPTGAGAARRGQGVAFGIKSAFNTTDPARSAARCSWRAERGSRGRKAGGRGRSVGGGGGSERNNNCIRPCPMRCAIQKQPSPPSARPGPAQPSWALALSTRPDRTPAHGREPDQSPAEWHWRGWRVRELPSSRDPAMRYFCAKILSVYCNLYVSETQFSLRKIHEIQTSLRELSFV